MTQFQGCIDFTVGNAFHRVRKNLLFLHLQNNKIHRVHYSNYLNIPSLKIWANISEWLLSLRGVIKNIPHLKCFFTNIDMDLQK